MDLDIRRVIKSIPKDHGPEHLLPLTTEWGDALEDAPLAYTSHPRPLLARDSWQTLDGWWECAFVRNTRAGKAWRDAQPPASFDQLIRVPFSPEASLSGVGRQLQPSELLWYHRSFACPQMPAHGSCILHFDGVDFACAVYVNGSKAAEHKGAYLPFEADITHLLREGENELLVCVFDPSEKGTQLRGKQRLARNGMWYTAQSGIWQSVWLEFVPSTHIDELQLVPNMLTGELTVSVRATGIAMLSVEVFDIETPVASGIQSRRVDGRMTLSFEIPNFRLWTPQTPALYDVVVTYGDDVVRSYTAFRSVGVERDSQGVPHFCLNHQPLFLRGLLDQGYWPDGLLTPPSQEAMASDIRAAQRAGFNMLRKHIKVESERFYALCDRMGMLVWQDMPSGGDIPSDRWSRDVPTLVRKSWNSQRDDTDKGRARLGASSEGYRHEWMRTCEDVVRRLSAHPCIVGWVLFNESWGQFDSAAMTQMVWDLDPSRPVTSVSGWYDQGAGDVFAVHNYFRGIHLFDDPYAGKGTHGQRIQMINEFGGLTWPIEGHSSLDHSYGYADYETYDGWRAALEELLSQADALEAQGLAGYVYTQLSDVEEETNGLLTYDRRVNKLEM
ncbi:MAG: glycoside hydrolase family 2 [Atopobiaceae bacterium]|nr:glycoside hydrolase family 2 [Atopobiaceae bacterium]